MPLKSRAASNTMMTGTRKKRFSDISDQELEAKNSLQSADKLAGGYPVDRIQ